MGILGFAESVFISFLFSFFFLCSFHFYHVLLIPSFLFLLVLVFVNVPPSHIMFRRLHIEGTVLRATTENHVTTLDEEVLETERDQNHAAIDTIKRRHTMKEIPIETKESGFVMKIRSQKLPRNAKSTT